MESDEEEEKLTTYLNSHPAFLEKWLAEKATRDSGFLGKLVSRVECRDNDSAEQQHESSCGAEECLSGVSSSKRNSISCDRFHSWLSSGSSTSGRQDRKGSDEARTLSEPDRFIELVKDISNELNMDCLCHKILVNVSCLTGADRCSLFLVKGPEEQRYLIAKLFDVTATTGAEEALAKARAEELRIPFGVGIVGVVAETKETVNVANAYDDPRFNPQVDCRTGYTTTSILALPICNNEGDVIGVAQVMNKKSEENPSFTQRDVEIFQRYLTFCGIGIQNAQLFETSVAEYRKNQLLLNLARSIFEEQTSLERLVSKIMKEAQDLLKCERSLVYLREVPLCDASQIEKILTLSSLGPSMRRGERTAESKLLTRRESKTVTIREVLRQKGLPFDLIFELNTEDEEVRRVPAPQLESSPLTRIAQYVATNSEVSNPLIAHPYNTIFKLSLHKPNSISCIKQLQEIVK
ncbi:unnamed protein product [Allacma fusca]|uniref:GAF domain-containing protein n=1 Tax=Allacma fusca TaxID=39272 RepID=A0A8J2L193_9HEXA|nr:unnamed protein product [Allacma fusca]